MVGDWTYPEEDLKIIKRDWELINQKIKNGKAHELSEGDTFYLGACTKGGRGGNLRQQPFSLLKAKQRAYSLKQGYVNHIIAKLSGVTDGTYGKIIKKSKTLKKLPSLEDIVTSKFKPYYGVSVEEINAILGGNLNRKAKSFYANLVKRILGIELGKKIEEFEKAEIIVKTVRLKENNLPKESMSFPAFKYKEIVRRNWENSTLKTIFGQKFFFVFFQYQGDMLVFRKVKFWNMPYTDMQELKQVWTKTVVLIKHGKIVKAVVKGRNHTYFPKQKNHRISHVRPHAQNANDTYPLPVVDELTGWTSYTKHGFWLNASYVRDEIFLK